MILKMDHRNELTAKAIQRIQRAAYRIEAQLMGFDGIPQLAESHSDIQNSSETFFGFMEEDRLLGFISCKKENRLIDIYRLAVDPEHFRKGIGRQLLAFLLNHFEGMDFSVSTGKANFPAKKLYKTFGFIETKDFEVAKGIFCTAFEKKHIQERRHT